MTNKNNSNQDDWDLDVENSATVEKVGICKIADPDCESCQ